MTPDIKQGEHVTIVGPTGSGKTFLARQFLESRPYVVVLDSKGELRWTGWKRTANLKDVENMAATHIIFAPKYEDFPREAYRLMELVYHMGGWTFYVDEVYAFEDNRFLLNPYRKLLTRGRSRGISVWTGTQRPVFLPLFSFSEPKHFFVFRVDFEEDLKLLKQRVSAVTAEKVSQLDGHEFVYYDRPNRMAYASKPLKKGA